MFAIVEDVKMGGIARFPLPTGGGDSMLKK